MIDDYKYPSWRNGGKVHNWKNYICPELRMIWETFTDEQKCIIAENADIIAGNEEWE